MKLQYVKRGRDKFFREGQDTIEGSIDCRNNLWAANNHPFLLKQILNEISN